MKFDIMFKKVSVNVLTCQLGLLFTLSHGKLVRLLLIADAFPLLKCHCFLSNGKNLDRLASYNRMGSTVVQNLLVRR